MSKPAKGHRLICEFAVAGFNFGCKSCLIKPQNFCCKFIVGRDSEVIQIWDIKTGKIVAFLKGDRLLEKVNIAGVTGLNASTIASLKELGAYS